ncbi:CD276 antigen-like protein [Labeo rohita]|uniref:CD276 antigen-like protein n=1 Tax=Labeo rohita TaxID=84645 RepID=A0A498M6K7_LABRO|nr:CD276 antigen-like protein [Labeo rohita]
MQSLLCTFLYDGDMFIEVELIVNGFPVDEVEDGGELHCTALQHLCGDAVWPWCLASFVPGQLPLYILLCEGRVLRFMDGEGSEKFLTGFPVDEVEDGGELHCTALQHLCGDAVWPWCLASFAPGQLPLYILLCEGRVLRFMDGEGSEKFLTERLLVSGSSHSISASVGEDVTLSCSVDSHITSEDFEEVSWKKTDEDENILVLVFQNNKTLSDSSVERYRDRVEFFTAEIPKGNFSLRLKSVRTEDKGVYMCKVFAGDLSANTTVIVEQMDFLLQMSLVICPNIFLFIAFVLWGVTEGSLNETVACCTLYFLRPHMLLSGAPGFTGNAALLMLEYFLFSTVIYSVLFKNAWEKSLNFAEFDRIMIIVLFVIVLLPWLFIVIAALAVIFGKLSERICVIIGFLAELSFDILPSLQFILVFYAFGSASGGFFIVAVLPVLTTVTRYNWDNTCGKEMGCSPLVRRSVWLMMMLLMNAAMVYFYIMALESEKDQQFLASVMEQLRTAEKLTGSHDPLYRNCCQASTTNHQVLLNVGGEKQF